MYVQFTGSSQVLPSSASIVHRHYRNMTTPQTTSLARNTPLQHRCSRNPFDAHRINTNTSKTPTCPSNHVCFTWWLYIHTSTPPHSDMHTIPHTTYSLCTCHTLECTPSSSSSSSHYHIIITPWDMTLLTSHQFAASIDYLSSHVDADTMTCTVYSFLHSSLPSSTQRTTSYLTLLVLYST